MTKKPVRFRPSAFPLPPSEANDHHLMGIALKEARKALARGEFPVGCVLADLKIRKIGQNIKYDFIVLRRAGLEIAGIDLDTMVLSYILEPNWGKHGLERIALHYLGTTKKPYESVAGKGKNNPLNRSATPDDCSAKAQSSGLDTKMLTSVVDGTKTMVEMTAVGNCMGLRPDISGMHGPTTTVKTLTSTFSTKAEGGTRGKTYLVGGETCMPFHLWEGEMPNRPLVALEVFDKVSEKYPARTRTFEECKEDILADIRIQKEDAAFTAWLEELKRKAVIKKDTKIFKERLQNK